MASRMGHSFTPIFKLKKGKCSLLEEEKKVQLRTLFVPVFRTLREKGSQKGSYKSHVQEPKKVPYITKNDSKEPKKVLNMVLKT